MTVIIAENTPDKVRGLLKRWFLEPKPNVFVGSVNQRTREKVLQYLLKYAPSDLALLVICDDRTSQGFRVFHYHEPSRNECLVSGHYLLSAKEGGALEMPESPCPLTIDLQKMAQFLSGCEVKYSLHS